MYTALQFFLNTGIDAYADEWVMTIASKVERAEIKMKI
jgi:hypothetical protein